MPALFHLLDTSKFSLAHAHGMGIIQLGSAAAILVNLGTKATQREVVVRPMLQTTVCNKGLPD